jgi:spore maturation protein CgeB
MRFLIVDTYYTAFLDAFYAQRPDLVLESYGFQWRALMEQCFGTADFYSTNLQCLGHEATEVVANCRPLQLQWAREQSLPLRHKVGKRAYCGIPMPSIERDWFYPVLLAQVKFHRPDIVHFQDPGNTDPAFPQEIRRYVRLISGQIASPIPPKADLKPYDLMLSSLPNFVEWFRRQGMRSYQLSAGFEPRVLQRLNHAPPNDVVFVGGLTECHRSRVQFLEQVARQTRVDWWGYGVESLAHDSPLRKTFHGPAWALKMYEKLSSARITLNHHIDVAEDYANNMRLYEATGVGSLLITDAKRNLPSLLKPGKEAIAYRDPNECVELIKYYLKKKEERDLIARSGQQRTLRDHSYYRRMEEFLELVNPLL